MFLPLPSLLSFLLLFLLLFYLSPLPSPSSSPPPPLSFSSPLLLLHLLLLQAMFWNNTAHSGLTGLVVLGIPHECTSIGGFTATHHWDYSIFSSTASSLVATHLRLAVGKVGVNLNVFGPNPVAHLLGHKSITLADSLIVGSLPGQTCLTTPPSHVIPRVSFRASDDQLGIMMSCFNKRRSKMDGTGQWHLSEHYVFIKYIFA